MPYYNCNLTMGAKPAPLHAFTAYTHRNIKFMSLYCDNNYFSYAVTGTEGHPTTITYTAQKSCRLLYVSVENGNPPKSEIIDVQAGQTISMTDTNTYYTYSYMTAYII